MINRDEIKDGMIPVSIVRREIQEIIEIWCNDCRNNNCQYCAVENVRNRFAVVLEV